MDFNDFTTTFYNSTKVGLRGLQLLAGYFKIPFGSLGELFYQHVNGFQPIAVRLNPIPIQS